MTDDSGIIGLGGVMGGETTEMSETTTNVLVEAAHWDAVSMFRTGKRHKISSEAGKRNERGVDPTICPAAADRVVELLVQLGGGTAGAGVTVVGRRRRRPRSRSATTCRPGSAGSTIDAETVVANLEAIGCEPSRPVPTACTVDPAALAARTSPTRSTWSRRSSGSSATTRSPRCCRGRRPAVA